MFNFLKRKPKQNEKPKLYHCSICNGNFHGENIDFFESGKASDNVCVRCAEYIKKMRSSV